MPRRVPASGYAGLRTASCGWVCRGRYLDSMTPHEDDPPAPKPLDVWAALDCGNYFGLDRTSSRERALTGRTLRNRLADAWRGLVNGWRGYL